VTLRRVVAGRNKFRAKQNPFCITCHTCQPWVLHFSSDIMGRFNPDDFGYNFAVEKEETVALVSSNETSKETPEGIALQTTTDPVGDNSTKPSTDSSPAAEGDTGYKLYEEKEPQKEKEQNVDDGDYVFRPEKRYRGGESFVAADSSAGGGASINGTACLGALCCCLTVALVITGGILISYEKYKDSESSILVGSILIVLAVGACLCACCSFCLGMVTDELNLGSSSSSESSKGDPNYKEVKVRLRRLNDRYEKGCLNAESSLRRVRLDVVGHIKEVRLRLLDANGEAEFK
jgi:hypothetical protein